MHRFFSSKSEWNTHNTMDKVAETSAIVEKKVEESAETETRKRPANNVEAQTEPGASEPKKSKTLWGCEKEIAAFDEACDGIKKEWGRAADEGRKLSSLIQDMDDWNHEDFRSVAMEFMKVSAEYMKKRELKERYEKLREKMDQGLDRFNAMQYWTGDAIEMVRDCKCEADLLEQMNGLTEQLHEMRNTDWVWKGRAKL